MSPQALLQRHVEVPRRRDPRVPEGMRPRWTPPHALAPSKPMAPCLKATKRRPWTNQMRRRRNSGLEVGRRCPRWRRRHAEAMEAFLGSRAKSGVARRHARTCSRLQATVGVFHFWRARFAGYPPTPGCRFILGGCWGRGSPGDETDAARPRGRGSPSPRDGRSRARKSSAGGGPSPPPRWKVVECPRLD